MDLIVQKVDGAVVVNAEVDEPCTGDCRVCTDVGGAVHNWLMATGLRYLVMDLQDEKDICKTFLVELLQLRKRHKIPFIFAGVMDRPKKILESYDFSSGGLPTFATPDDAVEFLRRSYGPLLESHPENVSVGETIFALRLRNAMNRFEDGEEAVEPAEIE